MTKTFLLAAAGALSLISGTAAAQNFNGTFIRYQFLFPDASTPRTTIDAPIALGTGIEFNDPAHSDMVDLSGSTIVITDTFGGQYTATAFNGIVLSDVRNNLAAITGVTFTSGGFAGEQPVLSFDADNIFFNFANITQTTAAGTQYRYNVTFADATSGVPEPATWAMMMIGFGGLGHAMRRRTKLGNSVCFA